MKDTMIISCFAGVGKTFARRNLENRGLKVYSIEKNYAFDKRTFVDHVKWIIGKVDVLFIPYYLKMEERDIRGKFEYILIHPKKEDKEVYLKRYKDLGFTKDEIKNFEDNWDKMIDDCMDFYNHIEVGQHTYALNVIDYFREERRFI